MRRQKLALRLNRATDAGLALLSGLAQQNQALVRDIAARPFGAGTLSEQREAGAILALDDCCSRSPRHCCANPRVPCTSAWMLLPAACSNACARSPPRHG